MNKPGPKIQHIPDEIIIDLILNKKYTDIQTARVLGISKNTVARRRNMLGILPKPKNPQKKNLTEEQNNRIKILYNEGKNDYEVAKEMHIGRTRLREWRKKNGIESKTNKKGLSKKDAIWALKQYNLGKTFEDIGKELNIKRSSVTKLIKRHGLKYEENYRSVPEGIQNYRLTEKQHSVLIGDLFGDGHICVNSKNVANYQCAHCMKQEAFVAWKFNIFKPISNHFGIHEAENTRKPEKEKHSYVCMRTWSTKHLLEINRLFYPDEHGDKYLHADLIKYADDRALAVWYMGDGTKGKKGIFIIGKKNDAPGITEALNKKFGDIFKWNLYEKQYNISVTDPEKFFQIIGPYILPSMLYKVPKNFHKYCFLKRLDFGTIYGDKNFTKQSFQQMSEEDQSILINDTIEFYRHRSFPYPKYSEDKRKKDFMNLKQYKAAQDSNILKTINLGSRICNHYFSHRYQAQRFNKNPMAVWDNHVSFRKFIENRYKHFEAPFSDATIRTGISLRGLPVNFNPSIAKQIYNEFLPDNGATLDFSAGYGGRLLGYLASDKGSSYTGVEPLTKSFISLNKMADELCKWSSKERSSIEIIRAAFEDTNFKEKYDLIFSSPPYFKMEIYGEEQTQSSIRYPKYETWLEKFWKTSLRKIEKLLKPGGYLVFSLTDYKKYHLKNDTIQAIKETRLSEIKNYYISYHNVYKDRDKLETLFVYKKI